MNKLLQLIITGMAISIPTYSFASEVVNLKNKFNADEIGWVMEKGTSRVFGTAFLTLEDGKKKGCANFHVELLPVAGYSSERIFNNYGNNTAGQILLSQNPPKFNPDVKEYHEMLLSTNCDSENKFRFNDVPKGDYYLIAFIMWGVEKDGATKKLGGAVMNKIQVNEGVTIEVNL